MKPLIERLSDAFVSSDYTHVQPTFDFLAAELGGWVLAEDLQGRLIYASANAQPDLWRSDYTPFSPPSHPDSARFLAEWSQRLGLYGARRAELGLREDRIILPLTYHGQLFAYVHIASSAGPNCLGYLLEPEFVKMIGDKLYIVIMGTMNGIRRQFLRGDSISDQVRAWPVPQQGETRYQAVVVRFAELSDLATQNPIMDYASIAVRHTLLLAAEIGRRCGDLGATELRVLHRREDQQQATIVAEYTGDAAAAAAAVTVVERSLREALLDAAWTAAAGLSPLFGRRSELAEKIAQASQIATLGGQQGSTQRVFTQQDIGLEAFLLPLTQSADLREYASTLLRSLVDRDPVLLETLRAYFALDANATRTAAHFRVDRRTITYRLTRIEETLKLDLARLEDRILMYLALQASDAG